MRPHETASWDLPNAIRGYAVGTTAEEPTTETERWDKIRRDMLEALREEVRLGILTPDQYPKAMANVLVDIQKHRDRAEYHDLWRWAESLETSDPQRYSEFVKFVRTYARQKLEDLGETFL